jgi:tetratricopeptide (TPR) repeat protein
MKTKLVRASALLGVIASLTCTAAPPAAVNIETLYQQGRAAYYQGKMEEAKKLLGQVLAANPNHMPTRAMLANIAVQANSEGPSLRSQYAAVTIPRFEVNEVTLGESLQALSMMAKNQSGGKVSPNFIVKSPDLNKANLTLALSNTPLDEVVRYLAEMAKAKVTWDKHAVVFTGLSD